MRKVLFCLFAVFFYATALFGQKKKFFTVRAGDNIMDVLPAAEVFYYPAFTKGKVFRKDGTSVEAAMNYNRLVDEIHFISPGTDTLALADEENIRFITIEKDTFCYDKGYVRLLLAGKKSKLAVKQIWVIANTNQVGALNSTNTTVGITSFTSYGEGGRLYDLTVNADIVLKKVEAFYVGNTYGQFILASRKNLLELFHNKRDALEVYLTNNKIDYNNPDDLAGVIRFLESL